MEDKEAIIGSRRPIVGPQVNQAIAGSREGWGFCAANSIFCEWEQSSHQCHVTSCPILVTQHRTVIMLPNSMGQTLGEDSMRESLQQDFLKDITTRWGLCGGDREVIWKLLHCRLWCLDQRAPNTQLGLVVEPLHCDI